MINFAENVFERVKFLLQPMLFFDQHALIIGERQLIMHDGRIRRFGDGFRRHDAQFAEQVAHEFRFQLNRRTDIAQHVAIAAEIPGTMAFFLQNQPQFVR